MTTDTKPTDAEIKDLYAEQTGFILDDSPAALLDFARAVLARWGQPAHSGEPVYAFRRKGLDDFCTCTEKRYAELSAKPNLFETRIFYTAPQPVEREPLTPREIELIDGMIEVQLDHAMRCDAIANRAMADKQKGWDMERVALLQKFKAAHGIKGGQNADT